MSDTAIDDALTQLARASRPRVQHNLQPDSAFDEVAARRHIQQHLKRPARSSMALATSRHIDVLRMAPPAAQPRPLFPQGYLRRVLLSAFLAALWMGGGATLAVLFMVL